MGNGDHGFKKISRISRILICVNLRNPLKSVIGNGEWLRSRVQFEYQFIENLGLKSHGI